MKTRALWFILLGLGTLAVVLFVVLPAVGRVGDRAAWTTKAPARLGSMHQAVVIARMELVDPPPHPLTLLWANYVDATSFGAGDTHDAMLELPWDEFRAYVDARVTADQPWYTLGDITMAEDIWSAPVGDRPVVVAFTEPCPVDDTLRAILLSDGECRVVEGSAWLGAADDDRAAVGLAPIPIRP